MRTLFTGTGTSGSWKIRGEQLGAAVGATVDAAPLSLQPYDKVVLVKRSRHHVASRARKEKVPLVYDIVDAWNGARSSLRNRSACLAWLGTHIFEVSPSAVVASTRLMAQDIGARFSSLPVLYLPHHARPRQRLNPIREKVVKVGYEGALSYLGWWKEFLEVECFRRGWLFECNPEELADLDIVVAVRAEHGYASRNWKSNVKLANAQATGTPCVLNREQGYLETACGEERWADTREEMAKAFDELEDAQVRRSIHEKMLLSSGRVTLDSIALDYREWLCKLKF